MIPYNKEDLVSHIGVAGVIKNSEGKILVLNHCKYNFWTIPIGKVKQSETVIDGLKTELFEETGAVVERCSLLRSVEKDYIRDNVPVNVVCKIYSIDNYSGAIYNKEYHKHSELRWMSLDEIRNLDAISDALNWYIEYLDNIC